MWPLLCVRTGVQSFILSEESCNFCHSSFGRAGFLCDTVHAMNTAVFVRAIILLTAIAAFNQASNASLLVSTGLYDSGTNQFYDVNTISPASASATSLEHSWSDTYALSDPSTSFLTGGYSGTSIARYGELNVFVGGSEAGSNTYPSITVYASAFFFDTLTFDTPSGTAYLNITLDGTGSITDANGNPLPDSAGAGVYGSSYATLLAGEVGDNPSFDQLLYTENEAANETFRSDPIPYVTGVPVTIEVAVSANYYLRCGSSNPSLCNNWEGQATTDFSQTALVSGLQLFTTNGTPISFTSADVTSGSGTIYGPNGVTLSPEPSTVVLAISAVALFAFGSKRVRSNLAVRIWT